MLAAIGSNRGHQMVCRSCFLLAFALLQASCNSPPGESASPEKSPSQEAQAQVADLQGKITKWQANRDKLKKLLEQMQADKSRVLADLVQLGVKSEGDLANNPKGQALNVELKDIAGQIATNEKNLQRYELAILKNESLLRRTQRQLSATEAGAGDAELKVLARESIAADMSLSSDNESAIPIDLNDTLKDELARYRAKPKPSSPVSVAKPASTASASDAPTPKPVPPTPAPRPPAVEKPKTEAERRLQETYLNSGALASLGTIDAPVILAVKGESPDWQHDNLQGPLARFLATKKKHPISGLFKPTFYSGGSFDALWNGDESVAERLRLFDVPAACLLIARVGFSTAAKTDFDGLVSVQGTLSVAIVKKDGKNGPWVFKASGAGGDEATAATNCAKRLVEAIDLDTVFP